MVYMKTHGNYLKKEQANEKFNESYMTEKMITDISIKIQRARQKQGLSQKELAEKAHIKQQQVSAIENGANPTLRTVFQVCEALNLKIKLASM